MLLDTGKRGVHFEDISDHRANNFDFLRFVLASLVLCYHCYPLIYGVSPAHPYTLPFPARFGGTAVDFFFVISGFLVTGSWVRRPAIRDYLAKRILRIYPAFLAASVFCAVVAGTLGADRPAAYWHAWHLSSVLKFVAYALVLIGPVMPPVFLTNPMPNAVDGSFWTLRYEFECYLLVALLGLIGMYRRRIVVLLLFLGLFGLYLARTGFHLALIPDREFHLFGNPTNWSRLIVYFLAGMACYLYRDKIPYSRAWFLGALAVVTFGYFAPFGWEPVLPVFGSYLLFYVAFSPRVPFQDFAKHGDFSYGVYVYAFPVQQILIRFFGERLSPSTLFVTALPIATLLAMLSWRFIESPFLKLKKTTPKSPSAPLHPVGV